MCRIKLCTLFKIVVISIICGIAIQIFLIPDDNNSTPIYDNVTPIVLWWTPFTLQDSHKLCGNVTCFFTQNRSYVNNRNLKTILYYGSDVEIRNLPVPRMNDVRWGLLHEESPRNNLLIVHEDALKLFNYSATFSRYSDVPLTTAFLSGLDELSGTTFFIPTVEKNRLMNEKKLAPVLYIQSNCDTMNDRDSYILELMKYIPIDSYGACLNNRQLPDNLKNNYIDKLDSKELMTFVAQYKFSLAFENAVCDDYITEKLWRPLIVGSVPIYYGSKSFKDWLPNDNAAIAVNDFSNPKELAQYLVKLLKDDEKYESYLEHKLSGNGISNKRLLENLKTIPKGIHSVFGYYVEKFECFVCEQSQRNELHIMSRKQYNCEKPKYMWVKKSIEDNKNSWAEMWEQEACAAKLLFHTLSNNRSINMQKFDVEKMKMYENKMCL